jgi:hypothetical protein
LSSDISRARRSGAAQLPYCRFRFDVRLSGCFAGYPSVRENIRRQGLPNLKREPTGKLKMEFSIINRSVNPSIRTILIASGLVVTSLATVFASGAAQAALIDRGGGLIYDTDLNITWLADANYAATQHVQSGGALGTADGRMTWSDATTWAADISYFDSVRNVTYTDWRLPTFTDTGEDGCNGVVYSGTDCGYNVDPASSEMAHLYFVSLGNQSHFTMTGAVSGAYAGGTNPNSTLDNVGPFTNFQSFYYWSGTELAPVSRDAWHFNTNYGNQYPLEKTATFYALAVRPGDVAAVPEAETYAMMLAGLGLVGFAARRRSM